MTKGFAQNVTTNIQVPSARPTGGGSLIGDLGSVAALGSNLVRGIQQGNMAEAKLAKEQQEIDSENRIGKLTDTMFKKKIELQDQDASSVQIETEYSKILKSSGLSYGEQLEVRTQVAALGGSLFKRRFDAQESAKNAEIAEQKTIDADRLRLANIGGYETVEEALAVGGEGEIARLRKVEFEQKQADLAYQKEIRELELEQKTDDQIKRKGQVSADYLSANIDRTMMSNFRRSMKNMDTKLRESGQPITREQTLEGVIQVIDQGKLELENFIFNAESTITDPATLSAFRANIEGMRTQYTNTANVVRDYYTLKTTKEVSAEEVELIKNESELQARQNPSIQRAATLVGMGLMDTTTLPKITSALLLDVTANTPQEVRSFWDNYKMNPDSPVSMFDPLYNDPKRAIDTTKQEGAPSDVSSLNPNAAINPVTESFSDTHVDRLEGKIELSPVEEKWQDDEVIKYMEGTIQSPKVGQFSKGSVGLFTKVVLSKGWENMDESRKAVISELSDEYASRFFGSTKSGAFAPAVVSAYNKAVAGGGLRSDEVLYEIGVNPTTHGIQVVIADDAAIEKNIRSGRIGGKDLIVTKSDIARAKKKLRAFANSINTNPMVNDVLRATAKARGVDMKLITGGILDTLSKVSHLPINEAFILPEEATKEETQPVVQPTINQVSLDGVGELSKEERQELIEQILAMDK
jgi:hypothetical protein